MIGVLIVDDHPAVRSGLVALLGAEPGLAPVGAVGTAEKARDELARGVPDVLVIDYNLPDSDGLTLCWDAKSLERPPRVLIYSAFARPRLAIAARVAGADAILDKSAPPERLFELVRVVARGGRALAGIPAELIQRCVAELDPVDIPIFGMAYNRLSVAEIAAVSRSDVSATRDRVRALIGRLQSVPEARMA